MAGPNAAATEKLVTFAVRYILPRRIYAVSEVCRVAADSLGLISAAGLHCIKMDILKCIESGSVSHSCDVECLKELIKSIEADPGYMQWLNGKAIYPIESIERKST